MSTIQTKAKGSFDLKIMVGQKPKEIGVGCMKENYNNN